MSKDGGRRRVLLIDGNDQVTRFLKINLEHNGYEVSIAQSIEKAEEIASTTPVDVVALASPEFSPMRQDVTRLRRAFGCPILAYGQGADSGDGERSHSPDRYIVKFYEPAEFLKAISAAIESQPKTVD